MGARSQVERLLAEVGRFLLVGGAATIVALLIFNVLVHGFLVGSPLLETQPIAAYVIANTIGMLISYQGSRTFAFRDRQAETADGGFTAYVAINMATMTIPVACLAISRDVLGLADPVSDNVAANIVGAWLGLGARFYLFRTYVFKRPISLGELYDEPGAPEAEVRAEVRAERPAVHETRESRDPREQRQVSAPPTGASTTARAEPPAA